MIRAGSKTRDRAAARARAAPRARCRPPSTTCSTTAAVSSSTPMPSSCGRLGDDHQQPAVAVALVEVLVDHRRLAAARGPAATWVIRCLGVDAADAEGDHVAGLDAGAGRGAGRPRRRARGPPRSRRRAGCRRRSTLSLSWLPPVMKMPVAFVERLDQLGVVGLLAGLRAHRDHLGGALDAGRGRRTPRRPRDPGTRRSGSPRCGPRARRSRATNSLRMRRPAELVLGAADDHEGSPGHDTA